MDQLPEDIGRTIFELAAEDGGGPSCSLVSKKVQSWVEPIMYRKVLLWDQRTIYLFCRTLQEPLTCKTTQFFALHVKILIVLSIDCPIGSIVAMLRSLRNIQTLLLWSWPLTLHQAIRSPHLVPTRLSLSHPRLLPAQRHFFHPMFENVTHLELRWRVQECWDGWNWDSLLHLGSHLTHLSLYFDSDFLLNASSPNRLLDLVERTISKCPPSVRVILLWIPLEVFLARPYRDGRTMQRVWEVDGRIVIGCLLPPGESGFEKEPVHKCVKLGATLGGIMHDWAGVVSDRKDVWSMAEDATEERRKGWLPM